MDIKLHSWKRRLLVKVKVTPIYLLLLYRKPLHLSYCLSVLLISLTGRFGGAGNF